MNIHDRFKLVNDDYLKFERVGNKKNSRRDMHAFILLSELFPDGTGDMVSGAADDEIWLNVPREHVETLTDESILELVRCGVRCDHYGELAMFVGELMLPRS